MRRVVGAVAVLLAVAACGRDAAPAASPAATLAPGALVPATPASFEATLRSLRGTPVVVNYWATWCVPCADELPRLVAAAERYAGRITFLGVDVEDDRAAAQDLVERFGIPYGSLEDPTKAIFRDQRLLGVPATHFFGADGSLVFAHNGEILDDELAEKLEELLRVGGGRRTAAP